jgi:hypothetical protein
MWGGEAIPEAKEFNHGKAVGVDEARVAAKFDGWGEKTWEWHGGWHADCQCRVGLIGKMQCSTFVSISMIHM